MKRWSLVLMAALVAGGCAHAQKKEVERPVTMEQRLSAAYVAQNIEKGKTTKQEVLKRIGGPNSVELVEPKNRAQAGGAVEIWNYWTAPPLEALARSGTHTITRMFVSFDDKGVVLDYGSNPSTVVIP